MKLANVNLYGRAEPIRMLLNHAKVPFEDVRLSREEWLAQKSQYDSEYGQCPILILDNGKTLT